MFVINFLVYFVICSKFVFNIYGKIYFVGGNIIVKIWLNSLIMKVFLVFFGDILIVIDND